MSKKGQKMSLAAFVGPNVQTGMNLPQGPDPNRDPNDDGRGNRGRRYEDDGGYGGDRGPGDRSEASEWRRSGPAPGNDRSSGGGFGGDRGFRSGGDGDRGGFDRPGPSGADDNSSWRRAGPSGGGGQSFSERRTGGPGGYSNDRGGYEDRNGGYERSSNGGFGGDRYSSRDADPLPAAALGSRPKLALQKRTVDDTKEKSVSSPAASAASRPAASKPNPFGGAKAVDTTQREKEIEEKVLRAPQGGPVWRRQQDKPRESPLVSRDPSPVRTPSGQASSSPAAGSPQQVDHAQAETSEPTEEVSKPTSEAGERPEDDSASAAGSQSGGAATEEAADASEKQNGSAAEPAAAPARPVGRWAALRESGGDDRRGSREADAGPTARRSNMGFDSAPPPRSGAGRVDDRFSRTAQPLAPPTGSAFAKRFGANFDRNDDRDRDRPMGGFERRDRDSDRDRSSAYPARREEYPRREEEDTYRRRSDAPDRDGPQGGRWASSRDERRETAPPAMQSRDRSPIRNSAPGSRSGSRLNSPQRESLKETPKSKVASPAKEPAPSSEPRAATTNQVQEEPQQAEEQPQQAEAQRAEPEVKVDPKEQDRAVAAEAVASGKLGKELKEFCAGLTPKPTAGALLTAALKDYEKPEDGKWAADSQLGTALKALAGSDVKKQLQVLYAAQVVAKDRGFPKFGKSGNLIETMFKTLYDKDICEQETFLAWKDDITDEYPGKQKAIIQTVAFISWLEMSDDEDEEDED